IPIALFAIRISSWIVHIKGVSSTFPCKEAKQWSVCRCNITRINPFILITRAKMNIRWLCRIKIGTRNG
ncbi:hypothetical protein D0Y65_049447, partial [Glycine soja]